MQTVRTPSHLDVTQQLELVRKSQTFSGSDRLTALLGFLIEEALAGRSGELREAVIGNAVYHRDPPYDPRIDSTVRVEIRRLRSKLKDYFAGEGRQDNVQITIPTGSYAPRFSINMPGRQEIPPDRQPDRQSLFETGTGAAVAVIPFRSLSNNPELRVFADGLTDELIFLLGSEPGVRVPSRSIVFPYADVRQPAAIAAEIGVDAVLQGTVREDDDQIRVTIELSDRTGFVLFSDRFEGPLAHRRQLQERIAVTLLSRVRMDSSGMRAHELSPSPAAVEAHAKIYKARRLLDKQTPAAIRQAMGLFQSLAQSAPDYARGFSGIADCWCDMYRIGISDRETALAGASEAARRALEIDERSVEAYTAMGTIAAWMERDREAAETCFGHALEMGSTPRTARIYGVFLTILGQIPEAEQLFAVARALEPYSEQQDIAEATSRYQSRRFDLLVDRPSRPEMSSLSIEALFHIALAQHFSGDSESAAASSAEFERTIVSHPVLVHAHAEMEAWLGRSGNARRTLDAPAKPGSAYAMATLAAAADDGERVLAELRVAIDRRELASVWIRSDIRFDRFRDRPGFARLLDDLDAQRTS